MSSAETSAAATAAPTYGSTTPLESPNERTARAGTGFKFFTSIYGILNVVTIISMICIIICAASANAENCKEADKAPSIMTDIKVSAFNTRNAVLAFGIIGLILMLLDTFLHVFGCLDRCSSSFDIIFVALMLVMGGVYLILGCCAAAWEQKMKDTVGKIGAYVHKGSAGAASFFAFLTTILVLANFILRLIRKPTRD